MARARSRRSSGLFRPVTFTPRRLLALATLTLSIVGGGAFLQGRVVSVADGDTVTVFVGKDGMTTVRLYGVDCPESTQRGGRAATETTRSLAFLREVRVEVLDTDRYGRDVALVHLPDGVILNEELLRQGQAWVYTAYCNRPRCLAWKALERTAKAEKKGLWQDADPLPPWKWRERNRR